MAQEESVLPKASDLLELASRPAQVIEHPSWTTARETALALITAGPCLVVLLGPAGTGKTTLLRNLATTLGERGRTACLLAFDDSRSDLGRADIVLADEADRMSAARLDQLSQHGERSVVLAVLPSSGDRFRHYPGVTVVRLTSLSPDQAGAFLAKRLAQLGLPMGSLTDAARAELVAYGQGVPRLLVALLGLSLFVASEEDARQVTSAHVGQAVTVRGGGASSGKVGPVRPNGNPAERDLPLFIAADRSTGVTTNRGSKRRHHRRAQVVAALVAICLFAAGRALLTDGRQKAVDHAAPPGSEASARVDTEKTASVTPGSGEIRPNPPIQVTSEPSLPVAAATALAPASPPAAPAEGRNGTAVQPAPAVAVVTDATQELPPGASIHIVLIYPRGDQAAAQRGLELARVLRLGGFGVGDPLPAPARESRRGISYYFAQDESAASEIGHRLGGQYGEGSMVRLPPSAGLPRPGTIEIALGD